MLIAAATNNCALAPFALAWALMGAQDAGYDSGAGPSRREVIGWQAALEEHGFSPGLIDGAWGPKTTLALRAVQVSLGLPETGLPDEASASALKVDAGSALGEHMISAEDEAQVSYCSPDWLERSRRERLLYPTLANLVAEKHHTSERCLAALNPSLDMAALKAGDRVTVPAVREREACAVDAIEVDLERKLVLLLDRGHTVIGLLHCSVARDMASVARGECAVKSVAVDPDYTFDPKKWPEVKDIDHKLRIPPGPRSPVGVRWIGLDRPGVGIHGSPEPENIGKTGSHGCFRLTNWDATYLASSVRIGTRVRILDRSPLLK